METLSRAWRKSLVSYLSHFETRRYSYGKKIVNNNNNNNNNDDDDDDDDDETTNT